MALEPQWEACLFHNSYGFRLGRNQHDALENLYCSLSKHQQIVANINLSQSLLHFDYKVFLKAIKAHPIIIKKVEQWLKQGLVREFIFQSSSFNTHIFCPPDSAILAPLLVNFVLNEIQIRIYATILKNEQLKRTSNIVCYGYHFLIVSESRSQVNHSVLILKHWLSKNGSLLLTKHLDLRPTYSGFNFLNYQFTFETNTKSWKIIPSTQATQLLNQSNREIIQSLKSSPIRKLIINLRSKNLNWAISYAQYNSKNAFCYIDKTLFSQLRAAILRRHPHKSKYWIKNKYFPSNYCYYFENKYYKTSWVLTDTSSLRQEFLPRLQWVRRKHYVTVVNTKSVYDSDYLYWKERL
nr:hypothetical protein [Erythrotrichia welwitschii]